MPRAFVRPLIIAAAALLPTLVAVSVFAGDRVLGDNGSRILSRQGFADLPGVSPQNPLNDEARVQCEQRLIDRARGGMMPTRGPRYETVNVCRRDGGPESLSPMLPPSNMRQLRGFSY